MCSGDSDQEEADQNQFDENRLKDPKMGEMGNSEEKDYEDELIGLHRYLF